MVAVSMPYKLIIVDDDEDICEFLEFLIQKNFSEDFIIKTFQEPLAALEYTKENDIAVIISDLNMPNMDGTIFLNKCKEVQSGSIRIVMTGNSSLSLALTHYKQGDFGFFTKPFNQEHVKNLLQAAVLVLNQWNMSILEKLSKG